MIVVQRLDKQVMHLNPDHIVSVEETPDTVITLFNGNHFIVRERAAVIVARIVAFRAKIARRSGIRPAKKYLSRSRHSSFSRTVGEAFNPETETHLRTPFHSQDW